MRDDGRDRRLQRVLSLLLTLRQSWEPLTRVQLEDRFPAYAGESGRRRFEDDKRELEKAGVPLVMTYPEGGRGAAAYAIADDFYLPDLGLTDEEQVAFDLAVQSVDLEGVRWAQSAGTRLGTWSPGGAGPLAHLPASHLLPRLTEAVATRRRLAFVYRDTPRREVDPYGVVLARGHWYLPSFCHRNGEVRAFRVDRIDEASVEELDDGAFERPHDFDARAAVPIDPLTMGSDPLVTAWVRVDRSFLPIVLAGLADPSPELRSEGGADGQADRTVLVPVPVRHRSSFLSWLLGFGDRVEVVEPPELRQLVIDWLTGLVADGTEPADEPQLREDR